jgi:hypothetical protein
MLNQEKSGNPGHRAMTIKIVLVFSELATRLPRFSTVLPNTVCKKGLDVMISEKVEKIIGKFFDNFEIRYCCL